MCKNGIFREGFDAKMRTKEQNPSKISEPASQFLPKTILNCLKNDDFLTIFLKIKKSFQQFKIFSLKKYRFNKLIIK